MDQRMRTPLKNVRRLGSAKEGTAHFWRQRLTAVANLILVPLVIVLFVALAGADHATAKRTLAHPAATMLIALLLLSGLVHMRLGMQTIIEDYVRGEGAKIVLLMLNTFLTILVGAGCVWAILKLSFGA